MPHYKIEQHLDKSGVNTLSDFSTWQFLLKDYTVINNINTSNENTGLGKLSENRQFVAVGNNINCIQRPLNMRGRKGKTNVYMEL